VWGSTRRFGAEKLTGGGGDGYILSVLPMYGALSQADQAAPLWGSVEARRCWGRGRPHWPGVRVHAGGGSNEAGVLLTWHTPDRVAVRRSRGAAFQLSSGRAGGLPHRLAPLSLHHPPRTTFPAPLSKHCRVPGIIKEFPL